MPRNLKPSGDAERLRDVAAATDASSDATSTYQAAPYGRAVKATQSTTPLECTSGLVGTVKSEDSSPADRKPLQQ
jgi:hypothetical protein